MVASSLLARTWGLLGARTTPIGAPRRERLAVALLGAAVALYAALAIYLTRGSVSYLDSLTWLVHGAEGFRPSSLLDPHNGHLIAVTRLMYAAGIRLTGTDQLPFQICQVVAVSASACLLFVLLRRRIDSLIALVAAVVLLFLGSTTVLVESNVAVFAQSTAFGLGALVALERRDRLGDVLGCALLLLGVLAFSLGIPFAIGAGVLIAARDDRLRRAWIVAVPLLLYLAWAIWAQQFAGDPSITVERGPETGSIGNLLLAPNFAADSLAAAVAAVLGLGNDLAGTAGSGIIDIDWGRVLAVPLVAFVALSAARGQLSAMAWALIAVLLTFWILGVLNVGGLRLPQTERYVFPAVALCILILAEAIPLGMPVTRRMAIGAIALACFALPGNLSALRANGASIRETSARTKALLATVELERSNIDPEVFVGPSPITAGAYLAFVDRYGSFAAPSTALSEEPAAIRESIDTNLVRILDIHPERGQDVEARGCAKLSARGGGPTEVDLPVGGAIMRARSDARIGLRRFAEAPQAAYALPGGAPSILSIPADASSGPWVVSVEPGSGDVGVCKPARGGAG